jgi:uncharacterized protein (DUF885 family)
MLDRRRLLISSAALAGASASPKHLLGQESADARLAKLLDEIFYDGLNDKPERATSLGLDTGERAVLKSRLDDRSAVEKAWLLKKSEHQLSELRAIGRTTLSEGSKVNYDVVEYQLQTAVDGGKRFLFGEVGPRFSPYVLCQLEGSYRDVPDFLDNQHQVETAADADAWLERLHALRTALDQELDRARADTSAGVIPPDFAVDTAIGQMKALRGAPAAQTVLVQSLARKVKAAGLQGDYAVRAEAIVSGEVFPALDRQIAFMEALRPKSVHDAGVWRLPDGDAYYAAALTAATTTKMTPAETHQLGLDQVAEITGRLDAILKAQGLTQGTPAERLARLNDDPTQLYPNTDEGRTGLIDQLNGQIERMYGKLPLAFRTVPSTKVTVKRVPAVIQDGAPNGYYQRAALDGSRPAIYFINLKDNHDWPKFSLPTLTYHEAVPGHHLQISIQQASTSIPLIRRTSVFSAFSEGWALYAEQLASELGMYEGDELGRAGFLQSFLFRAVRLVVDTGMHFKRWSREQAIEFMVQATGYARGRVEREIDRYCVWPGQACSYKVGHTVWFKLREDAKAKLGSRFDIKDFHDASLSMGAMPLTVLEGVIGRYVAARA